jgi:hypothetical protein
MALDHGGHQAVACPRTEVVVTRTRARLLFAYAGDSGAVSGLIHYVHKIVSPATYGCHLCALTYGPMGRHAAWKHALDALAIESEFLHRDELVARHGPDQPPLPAIFIVRGDRREVLVTKTEIDGCRDLESLIELLRERTHDAEPVQADSHLPI